MNPTPEPKPDWTPFVPRSEVERLRNCVAVGNFVQSPNRNYVFAQCSDEDVTRRIVQCVNEFDGLVAELEKIVDFLLPDLVENGKAYNDEKTLAQIARYSANARTLLARVKGRT